MHVDPRILELLVKYEELKEQGADHTEELCRKCPELLDEMQKRIAELGAFEPAFDQSKIPAGPPAIHIRCSHCRNAIEIVEPSELVSDCGRILI
jgi:hypothetical protein